MKLDLRFEGQESIVKGYYRGETFLIEEIEALRQEEHSVFKNRKEDTHSQGGEWRAA